MNLYECLSLSFQQSFELNASLVNISSEVDTAEEYAAAQFATVQALHENATELNATAHQVAVQQLQGKCSHEAWVYLTL